MTMKPGTDEVLHDARKWLDGQRGTPYWDEGDELLESLAELVKETKRSLVRFHDPDAIVQRVEGTLEFDDGTSHQFSIGPDGGWQQWGASRSEKARSVELLDALATAALLAGHLTDREDDEDVEDDS